MIRHTLTEWRLVIVGNTVCRIRGHRFDSLGELLCGRCYAVNPRFIPIITRAGEGA